MDQANGYYRDKVAIITGGAAGIGLALGEELLSRGAAAIVLFDRDGDELHEQIARLADRYQGRVAGLQGNVTVEQNVEALVNFVIERHNRIDSLFKNAGTGFSGDCGGQTNDDWGQAFALNFYGPLYGIRAVHALAGGRTHR